MVMECEIHDKLAPSETASLAPLGEDVEEMDITEFTEMTKFNTEVTTGVAGAELRDGDEDVEAESDGCVVTIETVVMKPLGEERWWQVALQVSLPFIVAGVGMVGAGVVLGIVQHWEVFVNTNELFILVPALLGLKGNLEMTLASRLATQANLGNMDSTREKMLMIAGNIALTQVQANVVGFLASLAAMALSWIPQRKFDLQTAFLLSCSGVATAAAASLILGLVMVAVVVLSRKCRINPDNIATPIAASLGDLTCLTLLASIALLLYKAQSYHHMWVAPTLLCGLLCLTPIWWLIAHKNPYTHSVLYTGWAPIIGAMGISSVGGLILDYAVGNFDRIAAFQPVINGVGGNLVAVQASRLSTALHLSSTLGTAPQNSPRICPNPFTTFFGKGIHPCTARVLMVLVVPGHLIFMFMVHHMQQGASHAPITAPFATLYLTAAVIQVAVLLYLADWMVHLLWKRGHDPDNFSIPFLTAMGDLLGMGLLASVFHILYVIGDRQSMIGL